MKRPIKPILWRHVIPRCPLDSQEPPATLCDHCNPIIPVSPCKNDNLNHHLWLKLSMGGFSLRTNGKGNSREQDAKESKLSGQLKVVKQV